jgi:hypothetical protein
MTKARLADPSEDSSALLLATRMNDSIESAIVHIVGELDGLIAEIEHVKQALIADGALLKIAIKQHFELGAEALAFRDVVRSRLVERLPGEPRLVDFSNPDEGGA